MLSPRELDEDDVRVRPGRRSRPRTRTRPRHADAVDGLVVTVDRGRYGVRVADEVVTAMRARELGRRAVVVGDAVSLVGDTGGGPDALARIVRVAERRTVLRRSADDTDPVERVVVANADQLVIVMALADPEPQPRLLDRCLVAAYDGGLAPLLCLTKGELADPEPLRSAYAPLGLTTVVTGRHGVDGLADLQMYLVGRTSVFFGSSGVGKSTLVNRLVPAADRAIGIVNASTGHGRHTSSSAVALELPGGDGWVVDTPGVRSFGLGHVDPTRVLAAFPDLQPAAAACPPGCDHSADADSCGLDAAVAAGAAAPERLVSLRRLLSSRVD